MDAGGMREALDGIPNMSVIADPAIETLEIMARADGGGMIRRQRIEQFWF